ncbi:unnamed protein product [Adineta steineri]|uniref:G-protein coupled receptors family 1 profile domain-containing protein n=1 Tax=Adineta steineri TaxID=433720 RepID=A0A816AE79_9BILA|nr:unnamed protein product [Adineta steineri]CAF1594973.1 unnamed protein product [Adineta steineri]
MDPTSNGTLALVRDSSSFIHPNRILLMILYRYGLVFVFVIGFSGNLASLVTFMSPILRVTSTSCLFFMVAISDTLYLLISIFDFVEVGIVQGPIFLSVYDSVCRFRWFSKGFIRFCSAWILVLIAIDRWIRTRFPFKVNQWCTRCNALITILITIVLGIDLHGHMLSIQLFGGYFPGIPSVACGPIDPTLFYLRFFFTQWPIIQVVKREMKIEKRSFKYFRSLSYQLFLYY